MLPPGAHLEPHADPFSGTIHYQLGLRVPDSNACRLTVDGIDRRWHAGEAFVFDKTYVHSATNETDEGRLVFLCDVERPMRWRWARSVGRAINGVVSSVSAIQNVESDPAGVMSRVFASVTAGSLPTLLASTAQVASRSSSTQSRS